MNNKVNYGEQESFGIAKNYGDFFVLMSHVAESYGLEICAIIEAQIRKKSNTWNHTLIHIDYTRITDKEKDSLKLGICLYINGTGQKIAEIVSLEKIGKILPH